VAEASAGAAVRPSRSATAGAGAGASAAPVREAGTRSRSGNAMLRTRTALLAAAAGCIERYGVRKTTMSDLATVGGVAKATLYNHFRTKDDVLTALVETSVAALADECALVAAGRAPVTPGLPDPGAGLAAAFAAAARALAASRPLRRVAASEPAVLAALATPGDGPLWAGVRAGVARVLTAADAPADPATIELVLRALLGHLVDPAGEDAARHAGAVLAAGLAAVPPLPVPEPAAAVPDSVAPERERAVPVAADPPPAAGDPAPVGVGWPA
jgi:AcrR family transcriptional regulator